MQHVISIVTCFLFAAHVALGCCAHHAHALECKSAAPFAAFGATTCGDEHNHGSRPCENSSSNSADEPLPADTCQHHSCQYVQADSVTLNFSAADGPLLLSASAADYTGLDTLSVVSVLELHFGPHSHGPELYVWHCALLI